MLNVPMRNRPRQPYKCNIEGCGDSATEASGLLRTQIECLGKYCINLFDGTFDPTFDRTCMPVVTATVRTGAIVRVLQQVSLGAGRCIGWNVFQLELRIIFLACTPLKQAIAASGPNRVCQSTALRTIDLDSCSGPSGSLAPKACWALAALRKGTELRTIRKGMTPRSMGFVKITSAKRNWQVSRAWSLPGGSVSHPQPVQKNQRLKYCLTEPDIGGT